MENSGIVPFEGSCRRDTWLVYLHSREDYFVCTNVLYGLVGVFLLLPLPWSAPLTLVRLPLLQLIMLAISMSEPAAFATFRLAQPPAFVGDMIGKATVAASHACKGGLSQFGEALAKRVANICVDL